MTKYIKYILYSVLSFHLFTIPSHGAGFKRIKIDRMDIGIWYPSDATPKPLKMGPRMFNVAQDARPKAGVFDVVLFSHGITGHYRNHHITAEKIADAGYIVIGLHHQNDTMMGGPAAAAALESRVKDMQGVLNLITENTLLSPHMSDTVHGVGYSLGGMTILIASGAQANIELLQQHCDDNGKQDRLYCDYGNDKAVYNRDFCKKPRWKLTYQMNSFPPLVTRVCSNTTTRVTPFINGHAIVVAPAFQGLTIPQPLSAQDVTIIAITGDKVVQPQFQTEPLYRAVQQVGTPVVQKSTAPAHHFAFMPQLPEWIRKEENIPSDPPDFDRLKIIDDINADILGALTP